MARGGGRPCRSRESRRRSVGAGASRNFRHRRYGDGAGRRRPAGARHRAGGQADGQACRQADCRAHRRPRRRRTVPLHASRRSGDDRPPRGGGEIRPPAVARVPRLGVLERRAHLFSDRPAQPLRRRLHLGVGLPDLPARRAADRRAGPAREDSEERLLVRQARPRPEHRTQLAVAITAPRTSCSPGSTSSRRD